MSDADPTQSVSQAEFLHNPDIVVFAGEEDIPVGATHPQGMITDAVGKVFGRSKEVVRDELEQAVDQMRFFLERVSAIVGDYRLEEVEFELGFSAQGGVVFVAQAGVTASISVTFRHNGHSAQRSNPGSSGAASSAS